MIGWIVRALLALGGGVTSLFIARDAPNFGVIQMVMALLLLILVLAVIAFWPERWTASLNRLHGSRSHDA
jgi:hypothetical protein